MDGAANGGYATPTVSFEVDPDVEERYAVAGGKSVVRPFGNSGSDVVVEASANLQNWTPVQTNALTLDGVDLSVPLRTNQSQFFRARLVP